MIDYSLILDGCRDIRMIDYSWESVEELLHAQQTGTTRQRTDRLRPETINRQDVVGVSNAERVQDKPPALHDSDTLTVDETNSTKRVSVSHISVAHRLHVYLSFSFNSTRLY